MASDQQVFEAIDVRIDKLLFSSDTTDYKVYAVTVLGDTAELPVSLTQQVTVTGNMAFYNMRSIITVDLQYDEAASMRYDSPSYKIARVHFGLPEAPARQWQLLDTLLARQPKVLARLHDHFAPNVPILALFTQDQLDPGEVKGIGPATIKKITTAIKAKLELAVLADHFGDTLSSMTLEKIWSTYKDADLAMSRIDANPYLIMDLDYIGFKKADEFAQKLGVLPNDPNRIKAGLGDIFRTQVLAQGMTYVTLNWFRQAATSLLGLQLADLAPLNTAEAALDYGFLINEQYQLITSVDMYATEATVSTLIHVANEAAEPLLAEAELAQALDDFLVAEGVQLNAQQRELFVNVTQNGLTVLNGSAGTGKTWVIGLLIRFLKQHADTHSVLLAPTGRASKVLADYTGEPATTIHAFLHLLPGEDRGRFDDESDWESFGDAKLVIVDESSMLTTPLAYTVLKNINFKQTHVLFVGDVYQLPPIGPGNFLKDLLESDLVAHTELTRVYRQDGQSGVLAMANLIRDRRNLPFGPDDSRYENGNLALYNQPQAQLVFEAGIQAYQRALQTVDGDVDRLLLIVNKNIGTTGRLRFNARIQALVNPPREEEPVYVSAYVNPTTHEKDTLRLRDRVMILRNDKHAVLVDPRTWQRRVRLGEDGLISTDDFGRRKYEETIVANGDSGVIVHIDATRHFVVVKVERDYVYFSFGAVQKQLTLAYAITVHKAQGGQADTVIQIVNGADRMLNAQSFYTALTRSQNQFIFHGDFRVLLERVQHYPIDGRHDLLGSFLDGRLTIDTFSQYDFKQILHWIDAQKHRQQQLVPDTTKVERLEAPQPFAVRYAEQLDILDGIVDEIAAKPTRD